MNHHKKKKVTFTREELQHRHRLSPRQADDFLGEKEERSGRSERLKKMQQLGHFLKLYKELENDGVSPVVLKGPMLSDRLYGDPFYRTSNDFDLLIDEKDLPATLKFFRGKGFNDVKFKWPEATKKQKLAIELTNQFVVHHPTQDLLIEIHWKLFEKRFAEPDRIQQLVEKYSSESQLNGQVYKHLAREFELLYLIIHGSMHAWFRLKWLVDIQKALEQNTYDHARFISLVKQTGCGRFVSVCNDVLKELYPDSRLVPGDWLSTKHLSKVAVSQMKRPNNNPFDSIMNTIKLVWYQVNLSPKWRYKKDILRVMFFNKKDLEIRWLPPRLIILYLFRPISFTLRKLGFL